MQFSQNEKIKIKQTLVSALSAEKEVRRVIIFGSFLSEKDPNDLDVAVFQDSDANYLDLSMRYRKDIRSISRRIPVDLIPIKFGTPTDSFLSEIEKGEIIYER